MIHPPTTNYHFEASSVIVLLNHQGFAMWDKYASLILAIPANKRDEALTLLLKISVRYEPLIISEPEDQSPQFQELISNLEGLVKINDMTHLIATYDVS
jgi:hypothetical protein